MSGLLDPANVSTMPVGGSNVVGTVLPDEMSQDDPWAWQEWAAQREPETYGWDVVGKGLPDAFSAGPAWWAGPVAEGADPHAGMTPEQAKAMADAGYTYRVARGPGYANLWQVVGPDGKVIDQGGFNRTQSLHGNDYAMFASILAAGLGGAAYGAGAGGSSAAGAAAAEGATAGGTAAGTAAAGTNWGAIGSAAAKSAALNGGMTLAQGGDLSDALKSAAVGAVTGGAGGYVSSLGMNPILSQAATGAIGSAARGGDGSDILRSGLIGGASGALSQWSPTDSSAANAAIRSGAMTAATGGDARQILMNAGTAGAGNLLNGAMRPTQQSIAPVEYGNTDLGQFGTFTGGNALTFTPASARSNTMSNDVDWNTYDYPSDPDPYAKALSGSGNVYATGVDPNASGWDGDLTFKSLFNSGFSSGGVNFGGSENPDSSPSWLSSLGITGGDLLKLLAGGATTAYAGRNAREAAEQTRIDLERIRQENFAREDKIRAENRSNALLDAERVRQQQLDDVAGERKRTDDLALASRKRRAPVSTGGLLMPQLIRRP